MGRVRVFIDSENVPKDLVESYLKISREYGEIVSTKAYGDFSNSTISGWKKIVHDFGIEPVQVSSNGKGKSSTDIKLIVDLISDYYENKSDSFVLVSNDNDFYYVGVLIKGKNGFVVNINTGIGNTNPLKNSFSECHSIERTLYKKKNVSKVAKKNQDEKEVYDTLKHIIKRTKDNSGYADYSKVIQKIYDKYTKKQVISKLNIKKIKDGVLLNKLSTSGIFDVKITGESIYTIGILGKTKNTSKPKEAKNQKNNKVLVELDKVISNSSLKDGLASYSVVIEKLLKSYSKEVIKKELNLTSYNKLQEYLSNNGYTIITKDKIKLIKI